MATKKRELYWSSKRNYKKNVATKLQGGGGDYPYDCLYSVGAWAHDDGGVGDQVGALRSADDLQAHPAVDVLV